MITLERPNGVVSGKRSAYKLSISQLFDMQKKGRLPSGVRVFDENSREFVARPIKEVFETGLKPVFKITLDNGRSITCTKEHKFLTQSGFESLEDAIGLSMIKGRAVMSKQADFACNGIYVYKDFDWMKNAKSASIDAGIGLRYIADKAGVSIHTIRKWLKVHGLQFTKCEVASYTPSWNKGVTGYNLRRHSQETIEKMRKAARRGPDSNLWRGGASRSERLKIADWCHANRSEFLRDANYMCQCGSSKKLEMHHIKSVASSPELAYDKSNIQVLCKKCHDTVHGLSGEAKTWRERSKGNTLTVRWSRVMKVEYVGEVMTYDMEVDHPSHNYVANGIVTHNSQRYASIDLLPQSDLREARLQDTKNRQNSIPCDDPIIEQEWLTQQNEARTKAIEAYEWALENGIAKEVARAVLPEGLTTSRLYMAGSLRSWLHFCDLRRGNGTQKETMEIADQIWTTLRDVCPLILSAWETAKE